MAKGARIDMVGLVFNRLTVACYISDGKWDCLCVCGKRVKVCASHLKNNRTKSCGCYKSEKIDFNRLGQHFKNDYCKPS